jgi:hypothetical protein
MLDLAGGKTIGADMGSSRETEQVFPQQPTSIFRVNARAAALKRPAYGRQFRSVQLRRKKRR